MAKTSKPAAAPAPQPPYIKRAHLRNVPPLRDVKVDFKPGLNIIIGKNGSGKTNFAKLLSELVELNQDKYKGIGSEVYLEIEGETIALTFKESKPKRNNTRLPVPSRNPPLTVVAASKDNAVEDCFQLKALGN